MGDIVADICFRSIRFIVVSQKQQQKQNRFVYEPRDSTRRFRGFIVCGFPNDRSLGACESSTSAT